MANTNSQDTIDVMLQIASDLISDGQPERAFDTYLQIVKMQPEATAFYNLGSLCAQGLGTEQSFLNGAYWFNNAVAMGYMPAEKMRAKCLFDYMHLNFEEKTPEMLFKEMKAYVGLIHPEEDKINTSSINIYDFAVYHMNKKEYIFAAKFLRAAAEFGNDGPSQNLLGVLYNAGVGVEKNDLVSLYWFDRATDNNVEAAKTDRSGLINAYCEGKNKKEISKIFSILSDYCANGTDDVPQDKTKAEYWRNYADFLGMIK